MKIEMMMPRMGESIFECTVLTWLKQVGDRVEIDESIVEVATDKIDTEVGATQTGILTEILIPVGGTAFIGKPICIIEAEADDQIKPNVSKQTENAVVQLEQEIIELQQNVSPSVAASSTRFYSPLVRNIAEKEQIGMAELEKIAGTGVEGRVTKDDILAYVSNRGKINRLVPTPPTHPIIREGNDEIVEMDRMRKMIAERMLDSKRISAHVTSFIETDMTNVVSWRETNKVAIKQQTGENLTYTPILIQAVTKAIRDFPMINVQVQGDKIVKKGAINIGMAVALPSGNLIVPVIKNADQYDLITLSSVVNDLSKRARENRLKPDELNDGTYTVSNIGTFGNTMGTPIIMQPQVAIMAFGVIQKKPAVIETPQGDFIGIRQKMFISHSYDHRIVDGSLGGQFLKSVSDYLEMFEG